MTFSCICISAANRRGRGNLPERFDSSGKMITIPEFASFTYKSREKIYNNKNEQVPVCYDYKFIGYFHVKTAAQRRKEKLPISIFEMLNTIENQAKKIYLKEAITSFVVDIFLSSVDSIF